MNAIVRKFRAPDPRSALSAVKAAFGDELRAGMRNSNPEPRGTRPDGVPAHALATCRKLLERGVENELMEELVRQAVRDVPAGTEREVWTAACAVVRKRLPPAPPPW